jgi:hypothetical protein
MFRRRTLFVVGAGASQEFGMPVGSQLAETIARKMDIRFSPVGEQYGEGDEDLYRSVTRNRTDKPDEFLHAAWRIRNGLPYARSIDDYLDAHREDELVTLFGKAAIVKSILEAERNSILFYEGDARLGDLSFHPTEASRTWLGLLLQLASRGVRKDQMRLIFQNVAFVVFNYDRCVEHFLRDGLRRFYSIGYEEADDVVRSAKIIHPYGTIQNLAFGNDRADWHQLASEIKLYTEQVIGGGIEDEIKREVVNAERVVFMGFAYHEQNMELLKPERGLTARSVIGTAHGMSDLDVSVTAAEILRWSDQSLSPPDLYLKNDLKCAGLLGYFAKTLESA